MDLCKGYGQLAKAIMEGRQSGADMAGAMEIANENPQIQKLVVAAYEQPRYSSEERKKRQVADFGNDTYLQCIKELVSSRHPQNQIENLVAPLNPA
jgi:hypothetical protein